MFRKIPAFFKLYRVDVLILSFLAFFSGRLLGKDHFSAVFLVQSLFIALFPYNFVYTLNSITDVVEDSKNKPWRPLPSGILSRRDAVLWLLFIAFCSISGTVILFDGTEKLLVFGILILGIFYSLPPFVLKKRGLLACFVTGAGLAYPMIVAGGIGLLPFSLSLLLHVLGVTVLKDLSDFEGDILAGRKVKNASSIGKIYTISVFLMLLSVIGFLRTPFKIAVILPVSSLLVQLFSFCFFRKDFKSKIYGRIIITTGVSAVVALVLLMFKSAVF